MAIATLNTEGSERALHGSLRSDSKSRSRKWDFRDRTTGFLIFSNKHCLEPAIRPISVDQTKGTNTGVRRRRDNLWNFPIPLLLTREGTRKLVCRRPPARKPGTYVKANGQRRSESRRGRISSFLRGRYVARNRINKGTFSLLSSFAAAGRRYRWPKCSVFYGASAVTREEERESGSRK